MKYGINPDNWINSDMTRAENELLDASWDARRALERADDLMEELAKDSTEMTDEEVEDFKRSVLTSPAPTEWTEVQTHIDNGEFSWRDVAEGRVHANLDVQSAVSATASACVSILEANKLAEGSSKSDQGDQQEKVRQTDEDYFTEQNFLDC